ncbi:hypothetical protein BT69DRAFT_1298271 [Atractiella rhizophila]|nr:hypothetical protein BT69DRAFT_1298271 [Atractiella rhizophila]
MSVAFAHAWLEPQAVQPTYTAPAPSPHLSSQNILPYILFTPPHLPIHFLSRSLQERHSLLSSSPDNPLEYLQWVPSEEVERRRIALEEKGVDGVEVPSKWQVEWMVDIHPELEELEKTGASVENGRGRAIWSQVVISAVSAPLEGSQSTNGRDDGIAIILSWEEEEWKYFDLRLPSVSSPEKGYLQTKSAQTWFPSYKEAVKAAQSKVDNMHRAGNESDFWAGYDDDETEAPKLKGKEVEATKQEVDYWARYSGAGGDEGDPVEDSTFPADLDIRNKLGSSEAKKWRVSEESEGVDRVLVKVQTEHEDAAVEEIAVRLTEMMERIGRMRFLKGLRKFGRDQKIWQELIDE